MNEHKLVKDYLKYVEKLGVDEKTFPAWEAVTELVNTDSSAGWKIVLELVRHARTDFQFSAVGAGPLETLLYLHGVDVLEDLKRESENNDALLRALRAVYTNGMHPRVKRALAKIRSQKQ